LTLVLVSSSIREGAVPSLRVSNYSGIRAPLSDTCNSMNKGNNGPINRGGRQLLAGKLVIYHGEPESYSAFISPEACIALDKYLDFRREHGEQITESSSLFRNKFDQVQTLDNGKPSNNNSGSNTVIQMSNEVDDEELYELEINRLATQKRKELMAKFKAEDPYYANR